MDYTTATLKDRYDLFDKQDEICTEVWPEFMLQDPIADKYWMPFIEAFPEYQVMIMDGDEILAMVNSVPICFEKALAELPAEGWDWGVKNAVESHKAGLTPNLLMGVQIVVNKRHQGKGLSSIAVKEMAILAKEHGFKDLVIPVRPSQKHQYPLKQMEKYITWKNNKDLPFDNWLRVHLKAGGEIVKVCSKAMYISGTLEEWTKWTGLQFPESGQYIIPGALNPIDVDISKNEGVYVEPNVWVWHRVGK